MKYRTKILINKKVAAKRKKVGQNDPPPSGMEGLIYIPDICIACDRSAKYPPSTPKETRINRIDPCSN